MDVPASARVQDALGGGKDNFAADRDAADEVSRLLPWGVAVRAVKDARAWLRRAVDAMAAEGVSQFWDVGAGLPSSPHVHEVAQRTHPSARVLYVDNDPHVMVHGRALMSVKGQTEWMDGDLREPDELLRGAREFFDWGQPVGLVLGAVLDQLSDTEAYGVSRALVGALSGGSYVALSHAGSDRPDLRDALERVSVLCRSKWGGSFRPRGSEQVGEFLAGLELVPPGLVPVDQWRPDGPDPAADPVPVWGAVARTPVT